MEPAEIWAWLTIAAICMAMLCGAFVVLATTWRQPIPANWYHVVVVSIGFLAVTASVWASVRIEVGGDGLRAELLMRQVSSLLLENKKLRKNQEEESNAAVTAAPSSLTSADLQREIEEIAKLHLDWITRDPGSRARYINALNSGKSKFQSALSAQSHNPDAQRQITAAGEDFVNSYLP